MALKFLEAFVPVPNRADGLLSFSSGQKQDQDNVLGKVDHQFTSANRASVRWLHNWETFQEATGNLPGFFASIKYRNINVSATDTHIIGPTLLNSLVFTFNDIDRRQLSVVPGNKNWSDFGSRIVRSFTAEGVPAGHDTTVQGRFQAFSRFPLNHFRRHYHVADRINWNKGAHFLKFGGEYRRSILDLQEFFQGDPQFNFNGQVTGDAVADFLLARPFRMQQIAELKNNPRAHEISAFFQDDWKVASRLTLNLGVRWDPTCRSSTPATGSANCIPGGKARYSPRRRSACCTRATRAFRAPPSAAAWTTLRRASASPGIPPGPGPPAFAAATASSIRRSASRPTTSPPTASPSRSS